jgi:hypothetical protein
MSVNWFFCLIKLKENKMPTPIRSVRYNRAEVHLNNAQGDNPLSGNKDLLFAIAYGILAIVDELHAMNDISNEGKEDEVGTPGYAERRD